MTRLETMLVEKIISNNHFYNLWCEKEPIIVAISGGKDSLALFSLLKNIHTNLLPVHIRIVYENNLSFSFMEETEIIETDIYHQAKQHSKNRTCCFNCSRLRRKALLEYARSKNAHKICLAHTLNDVNETLLLNLFFSREISTIKPKQELFGDEYQLIRPMFNIEENLLMSYVKEKQLQIMVNQCQESLYSKRAYIRDLIQQVQSDHPKIDINDNLFASLKHIREDFLPFDIQ